VVAMRRLALVLVLAVTALLVLGSSASARCVELPFDTVVRQSQVVWWGTVTGTEHEPSTANFSGGWTLTVRLQDVLKGPGLVGETRPAVPTWGILWTRSTGRLALCSMDVFSRKDAQQYIGRTQLFMGRLQGDVVVPIAQVLKPQGLSPQQQYQRALNDLGLQRTPSPSPLAPLAAGGFPLWAIIVLAALVVVVAVGSFVVARRRRTSRPVG